MCWFWGPLMTKLDHCGQSLRHWVLFEGLCWVRINLSVPITRLTCCFPACFGFYPTALHVFTGVCMYYDLFLLCLWYYEQDIRDGLWHGMFIRRTSGGCRGAQRSCGHILSSYVKMFSHHPTRHALIKSNPIFYQLIPTWWFVLTLVCARWI